RTPRRPVAGAMSRGSGMLPIRSGIARRRQQLFRDTELFCRSVRTPNLTVQQLEYLVAVSRADSWADAAAAVGVSPSALSQGLAELERRVGVTLFERDGRRRRLAPDAAEVLAYAEAVVARTRDLAKWVDERRDGRVGRVRVGMIDAAAVHHLSEELRRFRRDRADLDLRLTVAPSGVLMTELRRAALDLVVCV